MGKSKVLVERTTLRTLVAALLVAVLGVALLYLSAQNWWISREAIQSLIRELGGLLIASVAISALWELWGRRAFLDEVITKVRLSEDIRSAGIVGFTPFFQQHVDWPTLLRTSRMLDVFFVYGRTWRRTYRDELAELAAKKGARIRVVLPDPEDELTMLELSRRLNCSTNEIGNRVREAETYFRQLQADNCEAGAEIEIWFFAGAPQFTFYLCDRLAVLALNTHRPPQPSVPAFVLEEGGALHSFVKQEFDAIIGGQAGCIRKASAAASSES